MITSPRKSVSSIMLILTTALFVLFILFDTYSWGKYVLFALSILILFLGFYMNDGKIKLKLNAYFIINILFIGFVLISSLWAMQPSDTVIMTRTLARTFICAYMVYISFLNIKQFDTISLLKAVMWSGYIVAIYALAFYGLDRLIDAGKDSGMRVDNEFANVNTIGLACALSCVIQVGIRFIGRNLRLFPSALFMIPCIVVIAATQSRKAIVFLAAGILGCIFVNAQKSDKKLGGKLFRILLGICVCVVIFYIILQLNIFSGVRERMSALMNSFFGTGAADHSTTLRHDMRILGLKWFIRYPIGGIGMANPHILARDYLNFNAYLHDNFAELLCGGGIIGFCLYYTMYVYLFSQLWKYRKVDKQRVAFFALWLMLMLAMNFGMVTYYSKAQNFYLMIHFMNVFDLKRKATELCKSENTSKQ